MVEEVRSIDTVDFSSWTAHVVWKWPCLTQSFPLPFDTTACTGWLVANDLLLTNEHCIGSNTDALNSDFEFMAESPNCYNDERSCWFCNRGVTYDAVKLESVNAELDYALVRLAGNPGLTYG